MGGVNHSDQHREIGARFASKSQYKNSISMFLLAFVIICHWMLILHGTCLWVMQMWKVFTMSRRIGSMQLLQRNLLTTKSLNLTWQYHHNLVTCSYLEHAPSINLIVWFVHWKWVWWKRLAGRINMELLLDHCNTRYYVPTFTAINMLTTCQLEMTRKFLNFFKWNINIFLAFKCYILMSANDCSAKSMQA